MILLYSGTPGSGKSLHLASDMKRWIHLFKAPVIGNFDFNGYACRPRGWGSYLEVDNSVLHPEFLIYFSETYRKLRKWERIPEEHILLVIDECQLIFNNRDWSNETRPEWISFFTQHRKLGYRVILVAQFDQMIDKQIRSLIEYEIIHRKVKNIGIGGKIFNLVSGGQLHVGVKYYKPLNQRLSSEWFKGDKKLYSLYDSYTRFSASAPDPAQDAQAFGAGSAAEPENIAKALDK